jgi:hypothetical protein
MFKTAEELGITQDEYCALVDVMIALEKGEIPDKQFQMSIHLSSCGTIGCIAGWMAVKSKGNVYPDIHAHFKSVPNSKGINLHNRSTGNNKRLPLERLFYLWSGNGGIPPAKDGAKAIRNFLNGDSHPWKFNF